MKRIFALVLTVCLLAGCTPKETTAPTESAAVTVPETQPAQTVPLQANEAAQIPYDSRFDSVTEVLLTDEGISVDGAEETVYTSHDIIYYEDKDAYESGYPYGEGETWERHTEAEAAAHTVVNITAPGAYRISGKLSAGQIRVDLGEDAFENPDAVVELILSDADITCTVAPAILFLHVYECDNGWTPETATSDVDTTPAGANLILEGENAVSGSHVAKIYKDKEGEKKLWKQDGAIYSYMSMNVFGPGKLNLTADNEGLDTELHLTIHGGSIAIRADNDGINTNEDGVSVTTINGGDLHIIAGLGAEGDGIDSNGWLVINGGNVVSAAHPAADAGLDSDMGSFVNGGTVMALGSAMDWAESDSDQVTMNLQFAQQQSADAAVVVTREDGMVIFAYDPSADEVLAENSRVYSGAVISCGNFHVGQTYLVYVDGEVTGEDIGGIYDVTTVTGYSGGMQMAYTGTDVMTRPGPMDFGGGMPQGMEMPEDFDPNKQPQNAAPGEPPEMPEGFEPGEPPEMPEGFELGEGTERMEPPEGDERPEMPADFQPGEMPEGMTPPQGMEFSDNMETEANWLFYMQDKVNFFTGLTNK